MTFALILLLLTHSLAGQAQQTPPDQSQEKVFNRKATASSGSKFSDENELVKDVEEALTDLPTSTPIPVKTAPSSVSVIPRDVIERSGVRYLPDVLRLVPGLEVQRLSSAGLTLLGPRPRPAGLSALAAETSIVATIWQAPFACVTSDSGLPMM